MQTDNKYCRLWPDTVPRMAFSTLLAAFLLSAGTAQAGMYRWVDGSGHVHYGDTPPTTYQQSGGVEMNKQGNVIKRTQSEAERKAEVERLGEQKRIQQEQQRQAQLDRALTSTYTTEAEIDLARDRALEFHKLAINGAETRAKVVAKNLADIRARIASLEKSGQHVTHNLKEQLDRAAKESQELQTTIQNNEEAMVQVREKYEADKLRFRELSAKK